MKKLNNKTEELESEWRERFCGRSIPVLLWIALLVTPLIFDPYGVDQFRLIKEVFCRIIITIMLACIVIIILERWGSKSVEKKDKVSGSPAILERLRSAVSGGDTFFSLGPGVIRNPILFLLLTGILSVVFSTNHALSLRPVLNLILFGFLYFIIINYVSVRNVEKLLVVILITGVINGVYCIIQYMGWDPIFVLLLGGGKGGRMASSGFIGNPNSVGGYLASLIPLSLCAIFIGRPIWMPVLGFISLVAMGLGISFSQTLTAAISTAFVIPVFSLAVLLGSGVIKKKILIAIAIFGLAAAVFLGTANPMKHRLASFKSQLSSKNWNIIVSNRPFIWWLTIKMIKDRPVIGRGLGTFTYWAFSYQADLLPELSQDSSLYPVVFPIFKTPHNEYLLLGAEAGIPGMAAAFWLLASIIFLGYKSVRKFRYHAGKIKEEEGSHASSKSKMSELQRDYILMIGFACAVLVSALESLSHFYFHIAPSALLAVTALGLWVVIFQKN